MALLSFTVQEELESSFGENSFLRQDDYHFKLFPTLAWQNPGGPNDLESPCYALARTR